MKKTRNIIQLFLGIFMIFALSGCLPNNQELQVMLNQHNIPKKIYIKNDTNAYDGYTQDRKILQTLKRGDEFEIVDVKQNFLRVAKSKENGLKSDVWVSLDDVEATPTYFVNLSVNVPDAKIAFDGALYNPKMRVKSGIHKVFVSADKYLDKSLDLEVKGDVTQEITLEFDKKAEKLRVAKQKALKARLKKIKAQKEKLAKEIKETLYIDTKQKLTWQDDIIVRITKRPWLTKENFDAKKDSDTSGDTAESYCKNLTLVKLKNWRLPTKDELKNLFAQKQNLKNVAPNWYWSSTSNENNSERAWGIHFKNGDGYSDLKNANNYVRCVRDGVKLPK